MVNKFLKVCYNAALIFIFMFVNLLIISSMLYFFDISMSIFHLPVSIVLAGLEVFLINKKTINNIIYSFIIFLCVFLVSIFLAGHVYDMSYDGNAYHKLAVGLLKDGYNPFYQDVEEFDKKLENYKNAIWVEHYPNATWIYGASLYKITGNIETAKSYNVWILFVIFFIISYLVNKFFKNKLFAILMGGVLVLYPIIWEQIFTLYVDAFLGFIFFLTIIYMYLFVKDDQKIENIFILGALLIILMNIKFTGLLYGGLFCIAYYLYYLFRKVKNREFIHLINNTLFFIIIVLVGILVVGSSTYMKNTFDHKNPFYPLMGKDKIDIMTYLQPASFKDKSAIEKNFYSLFSRTANIGVFNNGEPELKVPFTYNDYEVFQIGVDTRIGGYGVFFGGLFLISLLILIGYFILLLIKKEYDDLIFLGLPFIVIFLIMFIVSDSWWARYSPQLFLIPVMAVYVLMKNKNLIIKFGGVVLLLILGFNTVIICRQVISSTIPNSGKTRINLKENENKKMNIHLVSEDYSGVLYNLKDYKIKYHYKEDSLKEGKTLYVGMIYYEVMK